MGDDVLAVILLVDAALLALGVVTIPNRVGKPREPISGAAASIVVVVNALLIVAFIFAAIRLFSLDG